jgi:hypothetical protein
MIMDIFFLDIAVQVPVVMNDPSTNGAGKRPAHTGIQAREIGSTVTP